MAEESGIAERFGALGPFLDGRTRRLWAAAEARAIGRGGIEAVHRATRIARDTIRAGLRDLDDRSLAAAGRVRRGGGGRTPQVERDPTLLDDLRALIEADTLGDPQSPLLWVSKSLRHLAGGLRARGHRANKNMVAGLLRTLGYSLQANAKTREGTQHPDRDAQFGYLNRHVAGCLDGGEPVISVDTKKKELVGEFNNAGRELRPTGDPLRVSTHDFVIPELVA